MFLLQLYKSAKIRKLLVLFEVNPMLYLGGWEKKNVTVGKSCILFYDPVILWTSSSRVLLVNTSIFAAEPKAYGMVYHLTQPSRLTWIFRDYMLFLLGKYRKIQLQLLFHGPKWRFCVGHYNLQQLNTSTAKLWRHGAGVEAPSNRRFPMVTRRCRCLPTLQGTDGSSTTSGKICKAPFVWWSGWTTGTAIWHERTSKCLGWLFLFVGFHCFICIYIYI